MHGGPLQLANGAPLASVQALLAQATPNVRELRWVRAGGPHRGAGLEPQRRGHAAGRNHRFALRHRPAGVDRRQPHAWWTHPYRK